MIPVIFGRVDIALPRINNLRFWMLPLAIVILVSSIAVDGGCGSDSVASIWLEYDRTYECEWPLMYLAKCQLNWISCYQT